MQIEWRGSEQKRRLHRNYNSSNLRHHVTPAAEQEFSKPLIGERKKVRTTARDAQSVERFQCFLQAPHAPKRAIFAVDLPLFLHYSQRPDVVIAISDKDYVD